MNYRKSVLSATQNLEVLGLSVDLQEGVINLPQDKRKAFRRDVAKLANMRHATCRKVASILGRIRSGLFALPALRAFSDELVAFVNLHTKFGWDTPLQLPPSIRTQVPELRELLLSWPGRKFMAGATATKLFSDASDGGGGG